MSQAISLFDYMDYRAYLRDRLAELRAERDSFSFRNFNRLAGIKSSAFLKLICDGKRNLGGEGVRKLVKGLKLRHDEADYFEKLVLFNQAKSHEEKNGFLKDLLKNKHFVKAHPLTAAQYHLFSEWYYAALLELLLLDTSERKTLSWAQKKINPEVPLSQLKKAMAELKELGLLNQSEDGILVRVDRALATPDEVESLSVANFHVQMSRLAAHSVANHDPQDREISALTIAVSENNFQEAKKEIRRFRKKMHSLMEHEEKSARTIVAHINLHLFKISK